MPLLLERHIDDHIHIGIWKIEEGDEATFREIPLSESDRAILQSIRNPGKQLQRLACRATLLQITGNRDLVIHYDEYRKPHLPGSGTHLSLTHTGNMAAAMLNTRGPAGIDLELPTMRIFAVRPRFLSLIEQHEDQHAGDLLKQTIFWSAKEALFKFEGKRVLSFSRDLYIHPFDPAPQGVLTAEIRMKHSTETQRLAWDTIEGYILVYTL